VKLWSLQSRKLPGIGIAAADGALIGCFYVVVRTAPSILPTINLGKLLQTRDFLGLAYARSECTDTRNPPEAESVFGQEHRLVFLPEKSAVWDFPGWDTPHNADVKLLLRYYYIPQDVLIVSSNLVRYQLAIMEWFQPLFEKDPGGDFINPGGRILRNSSKKMSGLAVYTQEFDNAFKELKRMHDLVGGGEVRPKIRPDSTWTTSQILAFFVDTFTAAEVYKILGILFGIIAAFTAGAYWLGTRLG